MVQEDSVISSEPEPQAIVNGVVFRINPDLAAVAGVESGRADQMTRRVVDSP